MQDSQSTVYSHPALSVDLTPRQPNLPQHVRQTARIRPQRLPLRLVPDQRRASQHRPVEREPAHVLPSSAADRRALRQPRANHEPVPRHGHVVAHLAGTRRPLADSPTSPPAQTHIGAVYIGARHARRYGLRKHRKRRVLETPPVVRQDVPRRVAVVVACHQPVAHPGNGEQLDVPVGLAGARVLAAVEEGEQPFAAAGSMWLECLYARERGLQVGLFQRVGLLLELLCREDEVLWHYGELVEHQVVRWADVGNVQRRRGVGKRIRRLAGGR